MPKINGSSKNGVSADKDKEKKCELTICAEENDSSGESLYILGLSGIQSERTDFKVGVAYSDYSCAVYSAGESLTKTLSLPKGESPVVGIKFSPSSKNILYTANRQGIVTAYDLRAKGKAVATITDNTPDGKNRRFASFEISNDDRLVVAGSEHVGGDAFILFWDLRYNNARTDGKHELLGGYWESHMDDVTALSFHPDEMDILSSGSTDGLINVFDLKKTNEESALKYSLNTESSVDRLGWLNNGNIWCTTHTHELQLWDWEGAEPYGKFDRNVVGTHLDSDSDNDDCYLVGVHSTNAFGQPFLLAGSTSADGQLRGLSVAGGSLNICYELTGNQQLVRDSWYHEKSGLLVTGGEMGILNLWKQSESFARTDADKSLGKSLCKSRDKQARVKPY